MSYIISSYQSTNREACIAAFKSNVPKCFTEEEVGEFERFLDNLESGNEDKPKRQKTFYYVVKNQEDVIGCGGFGDKEGNGIISFAWGLIHLDYHKKGFGEKLLLHRLEQIKQLFPGETIALDTTQHAYLFFEKYGFQTTKFTPDFYTQGMHRYDMIWKENN